MRRQIVYVGGSGRDIFFDQSAAVVADRIARSLQEKLSHDPPIPYQVHIGTDAHYLAPDIGLDIASIKFAKGDGWEPVIDILEVKYLAHFAKPFSRLTPLARAAKALWILVLGLIRSRSARRATHATAAAARPQLGRLDRVQAAWLTLVTLLAIGSVIYWIGIGLIGVFGVPALFDISLDDMRNIFDDIRNIWVVIPIASFLIVAEAIRKTFIEPLDQQGVEAFAGLEYQLDDKRFLAVPNAILDAIGYARKRGYGSVDLLAFSLGSLLATDAIFPRQKRERVWSPPLAIENWITIGYPYDLIHWQRPDYFDRRQNPVVKFRHWINVVVKDDFLGTTFTKGDERGIRVLDSREVYAPDKPLQPFRPEGHVEPDPWWDLIRPLRRAINHRVYWDGEDARAPTCFREVVHKAGWTEEVLASLTGPPPSPR